MSIVAIEDDLVARIKALLGASVREVDSLPGALNDPETLRALARSAPSVYLAFLGGRQRVAGDPDAYLNGVWAVYAVTAHRSGTAARRRGDGREIGAYEILQRVVPVLSGYVVQDHGTLEFQAIENLFSMQFDRQGTTVYAATFRLPMVLARETDLTALADFATYHATHTLAPDAPVAEDEVQLPQ